MWGGFSPYKHFKNRRVIMRSLYAIDVKKGADRTDNGYNNMFRIMSEKDIVKFEIRVDSVTVLDMQMIEKNGGIYRYYIQDTKIVNDKKDVYITVEKDWRRGNERIV